MRLCEVKRPRYNTTFDCPEEGYWAVIDNKGKLEALCSEHLAKFNTFGNTIVSWSRWGQDTTRGVQ